MFGISKQLFLALALGAVAMLLNQYYLTTQATLLDPGRRVTVVLAKKDIREGTMLTSALMDKKTIPERYVPKSAVRDPKEAEGQEAANSIMAGDYITNNDIAGRKQVGVRLSEQVEPKDNARAITIPVDELNSLSRSLTTGDRIDIAYTFQMPGIPQRLQVLLMQNVPIIATGSYSAAEQERGETGAGKKYGTVTVKLNAQDAMRLSYARQNGQITVLLRNSQDGGALDLKPITGIGDVLSANEKMTLDAVAKVGVPNPDSMDKLRDQFKEIIDAQKRQGRKE